jgi:hypothetical protein
LTLSVRLLALTDLFNYLLILLVNVSGFSVEALAPQLVVVGRSQNLPSRTSEIVVLPC